MRFWRTPFLFMTLLMGSQPTATKEQADAPNYRPVGRASLQRCDTCAFFKAGNRCDKYDFKAAASSTCDGWRPDTAALQTARQLKEAGATPTGGWGHGPGGLFSYPGLGGGKKKKEDEEDEETTKPGGASPGPSIKNPKTYEALRARGMSKAQAAAISNAAVMKETRLGSSNTLKASGGAGRDGGVGTAVGFEGSASFSSPYKSGAVEYGVGRPGAPLLERAKHMVGNHDQAAHQRFHRMGDMVDSLMKLPAPSRKAAIEAMSPDMQAEVKAEMDGRMKPAEDDMDLLERAKHLAGQHDQTNDGELFVFKQADGRYRWAAVSSNAYRDRDREIVSQKALENDVTRADIDGDYGPLRFWHIPGSDIGDCDFNAMHGRFLIESGTFKDDAIGAAVAARAKDYQLSIGFRHPHDEPDSDGVFHFIRRFERSLVPAGRAANPFTSLLVKEPNMNDAKVKEFEDLLGPDRVKQILGQTDTAEKQADNMGVAFKEKKGEDLTLDEAGRVLQWAIKAYEEAEAVSQKTDDSDEDDSAPAEGEDRMYKMMGELSTKMDTMCKMLEGTAKKEAVAAPVTDALDALKEADQVQAQRLTTAETRVKELTDQLQAALKEFKSVQAVVGDVSRATAEGYRPTQAAETVANVEAAKEAGEPAPGDSFLSWFAGDGGKNGAFPTVAGN